MTRFVLRALLAVAAVVTVGLGSVDTALAQKRGGTLTIVRPTDPVSLDPNLETTAPGGVGLLQHARGAPHPRRQDAGEAARSPRRGTIMSPTKVRFKLRPSVKFHDGTPFNAAAVKFTFDRALKGTPPGALGEPRRLAERGRGRRRPHRGHPHQGPVRPDPAHARHVLRGHRVAHRGAEDGRRVQPRAGRHRPLQVRGVEDQHPRDHRAATRTTGATRRSSTAWCSRSCRRKARA